MSRPRVAALLACCVVSAWALAGCASGPLHPESRPDSRLEALLPADLLLIGEQHDADEHQAIHRRVIETLGAQGRLAAVAIEMAEQGRSTAGLTAEASPEQVQAALGWNEAAWPWARYAPAILAAVKLGVPVLGANLPRGQQRAAMQDASLDQRLSPSALADQRQAIRDSHCDVLPPSQIPGMTRIQIARDISMAQTLSQAPRPPGRTVLLLAGAGHVLRDVGVPVHLPPELKTKVLVASVANGSFAINSEANQPTSRADMVWTTPALPPQDHCAELRQQMLPAARTAP